MRAKNMAKKKAARTSAMKHSGAKQGEWKVIQASAVEDRAAGAGAGEPAKAGTQTEAAEAGALIEQAREAAVEKAKQIVYDELSRIIKGITGKAKKGNHNAAKVLFQFAGVKGFEPAAKPVKKEAPAKAPSAEKPVLESPKEAVLSFYKKLGMTPPGLMPARVGLEPEAAAEPWMVKPAGDVVAPGGP